IPAPDHDPGVDLLPDPGYREEDGGLDLPQVHLDRVDRLGEVERAPAGHRRPGGEDPLGHVAERQVGEDDVVAVDRPAVTAEDPGATETALLVDHLVDAEGEVGVREHGAFGGTGGPGGVDEG